MGRGLALLLSLALSAAAVTFVLYICNTLKLELTSLGALNTFVFSCMVGWYALDVQLPRREIYLLLGQYERPLLLELRFFRLVALLTTSLIGIASAGLALTEIDLEPGQVAPLNWRHLSF